MYLHSTFLYSNYYRNQSTLFTQFCPNQRLIRWSFCRLISMTFDRIRKCSWHTVVKAPVDNNYAVNVVLFYSPSPRLLKFWEWCDCLSANCLTRLLQGYLADPCLKVRGVSQPMLYVGFSSSRGGCLAPPSKRIIIWGHLLFTSFWAFLKTRDEWQWESCTLDLISVWFPSSLFPLVHPTSLHYITLPCMHFTSHYWFQTATLYIGLNFVKMLCSFLALSCPCFCCVAFEPRDVTMSITRAIFSCEWQ